MISAMVSFTKTFVCEALMDHAFAKKAYDEQYADLSRRLDEAVQRKVKFAEAMSEDNKWLTLMKSVSGAETVSYTHLKGILRNEIFRTDCLYTARAENPRGLERVASKCLGRGDPASSKRG